MVEASHSSAVLINQSPEKPFEPEESPTQKVVKPIDIRVYQEAAPDSEIHEQRRQSAPVLAKVADRSSAISHSQVSSAQADKAVSEVPVTQLADEAQHQSEQPVPAESESQPGTMDIREVELTPEQLAQHSIQRAEKALDANKIGEAVSEYKNALRYQPGDDVVRQKLAALYYGKKEVRRAVELLQQGIKRNKESQKLRLALARLLLRENQPEAALSPLAYLPVQPDTNYLAMRAALAQQYKVTDIALDTYQLLVQREEANARWWLGLAIQQERNQRYSEAKASYLKALKRVGISGKTQTFIRDRLSLLETLEETENED
jgi:MSHA biogenesis protein MshN